MSVLDRIDKRELRELISKGWMTHDAMWFFHCMQEIGIEKTNRLNKAAIVSMSSFEVERYKEALGMKGAGVETFEDLVRFLDGAFDLILPAFMRLTYTVSEHNVFAWEWEKDRCFAYKGVKRIGALDQYQCGVLHRVESWLRALNVKYTMHPEVTGCLMRDTGQCKGEIRFFFENPIGH